LHLEAPDRMPSIQLRKPPHPMRCDTAAWLTSPHHRPTSTRSQRSTRRDTVATLLLPPAVGGPVRPPQQPPFKTPQTPLPNAIQCCSPAYSPTPLNQPAPAPNVTDRQDHAPRSSHRHSRTVDLHHDCCYGICCLQDIGRFHYGFICYESSCLSHLLSVCLVL
jgi:hypothetical protein